MAGSKSKHSKNKGKSKSKKSDAIDKKSGRFDAVLNLSQTSESCCDWPDYFKGDNPHNCAMATCRSNYAEYEVEELLYTKIEKLYTEAKAELSKLGYSERDIERAILKNGYIDGPKYLLDNILANTLAYLEGKENDAEERQGFENMRELYEHGIRIMLDATLSNEETATIPDAMWHLLLMKWPISMDIQFYSRNHSTIIKEADPVDSSSSFEKDLSEDADSDWEKIPFYERINKLPSLKDHLKRNVTTLAADIRLRFPNINEQDFSNDNVMEASEDMDPDFLEYITNSSFQEFLNGLPETSSCNSQIAMISDLVMNIRNLEEEVKRNKEWAQQKVILAAKRVSENLLEMNVLRMEVDKNKKEKEKNNAKRFGTLKLIEIEQILREKISEAEVANERVGRLEIENAEMRSEIGASNLNLGISSRDLEDVLKRERKWLKRGKDLEEQRAHLQEQFDEQKLRVLQLQQELLEIEKGAKETEMQWRQEMQKKDQMSICLSDEIRNAEIQKANSRVELSKLRQKLEIDSQLAKDEHHRLEDELSSLHLSVKMEDLSMVDNNNLVFDNPEAISYTSSASRENEEILSQIRSDSNSVTKGELISAPSVETSKESGTPVSSLAMENGIEMIFNGNFSGHGAICPDEEEEASFLRSLGWEENEGEDEGLTEDEIKAFYEKYMNRRPSFGTGI